MPSKPTPRASAPRVLRLRIVVVDPPAAVSFALQVGKSELRAPDRVSKHVLAFEFEVRVDGTVGTGAPRFLGPAVQGPPTARFVYISSGKRAGDATSCWDRRAKVPLSSITLEQIDAAISARGLLEARIAGTGRDGGPACASVPLELGHFSVEAR